MSNKIFILLALIILAFSSCTKETAEVIKPLDTPVSFNSVLVNYEKITDFEIPILASIEEGIHVHLRLSDESLVTSYELYFLVNDNPELRNKAILSPDCNTSSISAGYTNNVLPRLQLDNNDNYISTPGDKFYFYAIAKDDTENVTKLSFVIEFE